MIIMKYYLLCMISACRLNFSAACLNSQVLARWFLSLFENFLDFCRFLKVDCRFTHLFASFIVLCFLYFYFDQSKPACRLYLFLPFLCLSIIPLCWFFFSFFKSSPHHFSSSLIEFVLKLKQPTTNLNSQWAINTYHELYRTMHFISHQFPKFSILHQFQFSSCPAAVAWYPLTYHIMLF